MPRLRTGRPAGRPKTKDYATLLARVPQDLADQAKDYAELHDTSVSALIREGLEWRLQTMLPQQESTYNSNTYIAHNRLTTVQEHATLLSRLAQALQHSADTLRRVSAQTDDHGQDAICDDYCNTEIRTGEYNSNTELQRATEDETYFSNTQIKHIQNISDTVLQEDVQPFDGTKYALGKLCPQGHAYGTTGQSLRRLPKFVCLECDRTRARARRAGHETAGKSARPLDTAETPSSQTALLVTALQTAQQPLTLDALRALPGVNSGRIRRNVARLVAQGKIQKTPTGYSAVEG